MLLSRFYILRQTPGIMKMCLRIYVSSLLIILITGAIASLNAQNRDTYFKTFPGLNESSPQWVRLMYSGNPNVYEVDFEYSKYYRENVFEKNIHTQNYKHWRMLIEPLIDSEGNIASQKTYKQKNRSLKTNTWSCVGPLETYNTGSEGSFPVSWQANVYCMDVYHSNSDILFAGTESGGLFRSIDKGLNWSLISQDIPLTTITDIKVSQSDSSVVYVTGHDLIYKSTDFGSTWTFLYDMGNTGYQLLIHPNNPSVVFCAGAAGLFKSADGGLNWSTLFTDKCWDLSQHPANPQVIYLVKNNATLVRCEFYKTIDGGNTWSLKSNGWYSPSNTADATDIGSRIAVTPADTNMVYVALIGESKLNDNGWIGVYRSIDGGESWINPNLPDGGPYNVAGHPNLASFNPDGTGFHQGFFNFAIGVSHQNPATVWIGCLAPSVSTDSAKTWTRIGAYNSGSNDIGWIHPDIQDICISGTDVWLCSDGGINYSTDELNSTESRKYGISGSNYWGFDQGWNEDVMVGGRYHNGNSGYVQGYGTGNSLRLGGAEAPTGYINPLENKKAYFSDISTKMLPATIDGAIVNLSQLSIYPNEAYTTSYSSEIEYDPRYANHFYLGKDSKIWKTSDGGNTFSIFKDFGLNGKVLEIEISRSNNDVMYCVFQDGGGYWDWCKIYKTVDGGASWSLLSNTPGNRWRLEISLNPVNENELWVISVNGANGEKVFSTSDGGITWQNRSTSVLDDEKTLDVLYQAGTSGVVYLATDYAVYYYSQQNSEWIDYSGGLPYLVRTLEFKPFYKENKIKLSTGGRGIWEADMVVPSVPLAQAMTATDSVWCSRDSVMFDSYSVVNQSGVSWMWAFSPQPQFVSSNTVRNPKVVFGYDDEFDVSLTVTDSTGGQSTSFVNNMVVVNSICEPDTIPGFAMECSSTGDYAVTPEFNIRTNELSITAWVKPNGIQPEYTGIVINNGTTAGINFRPNNQLAYHWPGGAWWWDSGLFVETDKWSHVALVASANGLSVYLNGVMTTHTFIPDSVDIGTMMIGSYKGWNSRNFSGQIDEVCIWNRSLSTNEIRESRHLTKEDLVLSDPDLIAYYQFNEMSGSVLDRAGYLHASLHGGAVRVYSTIPVGSGESQILNLSASGNYNYTYPDVQLTLSGNTTYPDGDVVVSRINLLPNVLPNSNSHPGTYWIINNYGTNLIFQPIEVLAFGSFYGNLSAAAIANPDKASLYTRAENEDLNTWSLQCDGDSISPAHIVFSTGCSVAESAQLFIASNDPSIDLLDGLITVNEELPSGPEKTLVYPNPLSKYDKLYISLDSSESIRVKLYDSAGKLKQDHILPANTLKAIELDNLSDGIYFYLIESDTRMYTGKVVVQ